MEVNEWIRLKEKSEMPTCKSMNEKGMNLIGCIAENFPIALIAFASCLCLANNMKILQGQHCMPHIFFSASSKPITDLILKEFMRIFSQPIQFRLSFLIQGIFDKNVAMDRLIGTNRAHHNIFLWTQRTHTINNVPRMFYLISCENSLRHFYSNIIVHSFIQRII